MWRGVERAGEGECVLACPQNGGAVAPKAASAVPAVLAAAADGTDELSIAHARAWDRKAYGAVATAHEPHPPPRVPPP